MADSITVIYVRTILVIMRSLDLQKLVSDFTHGEKHHRFIKFQLNITFDIRLLFRFYGVSFRFSILSRKEGFVMAYKALYSTYRPTSFEKVVGQQHIVKTLQNAVLKHKIAHAYLFCGPRGTGKTTVAKLMAKAVNCPDTNKAPCNVCDSCLSIQAGTHPDIIEIDAASNNGVDEIRDLIEKVKYSPIEGKYKVYIIDEVHMLSQGAFNALLRHWKSLRHMLFLFGNDRTS
jgi:replication-associated recombination protein RarA